MIQQIQDLLVFTALPNVHPAVVHFPIALLLTAVGFDIACVFARKYPWLDRAATALYLLGTAAAGAAYLSGDHAAETLPRIPGAAAATLATHERWALLTLCAFAGVSALRFLVTWLSRRDRRVQIGFFRLIALMAALAAPVLLVITAEYGGRLVYSHGLGVGVKDVTSASSTLGE
jgi:uncharacterized membrane protein